MIRRDAPPHLRPFVASLWASEDGEPTAAAARELVVPNGGMHLAIRLDAPLRLFSDAADLRGQLVGHAVVGGARTLAHHRCLATPSRSVGVQLRPGVAAWLFGASATELAERHTPLDALWGRTTLHERLCDAPTAAARLLVLEHELGARLAGATRLHALPAAALARIHVDPTTPIAAIAAHAGFSQRRVLDLFRDAVGVSPKRYARLLRLQRALPQLAAGARAIDVAAATGYADEAHLHRELRDVTGLSVRAYRAAAPASPNHVPVPTSIPSKTPPRRRRTLPA